MATIQTPKGLPVQIYRCADMPDCTNNGVSARANTALVIGDNIPPVFEAGPFIVLRLTRGNIPGTAKLVPVSVTHNHTMFGGNYAASSDSRFTKAVETITGGPFYGAVPIHDRVES